MMLSSGLVRPTTPPPPPCFAHDPVASSSAPADAFAPFHGDYPLIDDPYLTEDSDDD